MSSARLDKLFASTSFRLAAINAALLVVAFVLASAGAWIATKSAAENEIRERVELEMSALQQEIRLEGMAAAVTAIRTRAESPGALEYRLSDAEGRVLIGDLALDHPRLGWSVLSLAEPEARERSTEDFLVLTATTPTGAMLSIGDDLERAERVRAAVLGTLLWVGLGALALALVAGAVAARGALRRMEALSRTMAVVGAGDLAARVPESGSGDDIAQLEHGINEMLARIVRLVANVKRVSTDIAHDLRTPLTHMREQVEAIVAATNLPAAQEAGRSVQTRIENILRIFDAMLRLAEIETGSARARFAPVELAALVERVADAYRPDIEAAGHLLVVGPLVPSVVVGDADLIAQALANLIENAMRHAPSGGQITLSVATDHNGVRRLQIEDRGPGIPARERARVLEPFARLDASRSAPGAGLGLSMVNAVAALHGAELVFEDAEPGLRVALQWPAHSERAHSRH